MGVITETNKENINELVCKVKITLNNREQIGSQPHDGSRKPVVFRGQFNGEIPVAIKRYGKKGDDIELFNCAKRNLEMLSSEKNRHSNVIRYYGAVEDAHFK